MQVRTILRKATRKPDDKLNIFTFPTHERYETSLCQTGHNFYSFEIPGMKSWNPVFAPVPDNYTILKAGNGTLNFPDWMDADLIISQDKPGQFLIAQQIKQALGIPIVTITHRLPPPNASKGALIDYRSMQGDVEVFVSEYQQEAWGYKDDYGIVNHTGVCLDVFKPTGIERQDHVLSICNEWIQRDWACGYTLWREITGFPTMPCFKVRVLGDTPGLSLPAKSVSELVQAYNEAGVFLNTTLVSSLPTVILEAMACGCPVVSTATCLIPKMVIQHGVNGFVSNDPGELRGYCQMLLKDKDLARRIGEAGRRTIEQKFSINRFVNDWNDILYKAVQ